MEDTPEFEQKERVRAALFKEAALIVRTAGAQSRALSADEDERVLELLARVRVLAREIEHSKKNGRKGGPEQKVEARQS
jgi:hypothetical protein